MIYEICPDTPAQLAADFAGLHAALYLATMPPDVVAMATLEALANSGRIYAVERHVDGSVTYLLRSADDVDVAMTIQTGQRNILDNPGERIGESTRDEPLLPPLLDLIHLHEQYETFGAQGYAQLTELAEAG